MTSSDGSRNALQTGTGGVGPIADLTLVWDAVGRPRGRSPRQWLRSTVGRRAVAVFAARRGVAPHEVYHDPVGRGARVYAIVPLGWMYEMTVDAEMAAAGPGGLGDDLALARRLLADEARRRDEVERLRDEYRLPVNAVDRLRDGVSDRWTAPNARPGDPRPRGAPPWNDSGRRCPRCRSEEAVALASVRPDVWLCHECRRR